MTTIRIFFENWDTFFPISEKGQGRPPSPLPSSYVPTKYGSDNYKALPNLFVRATFGSFVIG